jgi:Na+-driven multidrug efflux pump
MLMKVTLVCSVAVWLLVMLFTRPVVQLTIGDGDMTDYAVGMTRLAFCVFFVSTLQFACQSTLQAMDRPVVTFWLGLSRTLLLLVPLVWLLPRLFSSHADAAVFMAQPVVDVLVCAVSVLLLQRSLHNLKPKQ